MPATVWSNVTVNVQSALATAVTISGISKFDPAVVSHSGTDPSDGNYVVFPDLQGMTQMSDRVVRVDTVLASTSFEAESIDSTNFGTFTSGSFQEITFGTSLSTITGVTASGGESNFVDATVIHSNQVRELPTTFTPLELDFDSVWDPGDTALQALQTASENQERRAVQLIFATGGIVVFYGYVTATLIPTGGAQELVTTAVNIRSSGLVTTYAS